MCFIRHITWPRATVFHHGAAVVSLIVRSWLVSVETPPVICWCTSFYFLFLGKARMQARNHVVAKVNAICCCRLNLVVLSTPMTSSCDKPRVVLTGIGSTFVSPTKSQKVWYVFLFGVRGRSTCICCCRTTVDCALVLILFFFRLPRKHAGAYGSRTRLPQSFVSSMG